MLLSIDPGLAGTGWAYWLDDTENEAPYRTGVLKLPNRLRKADFVVRARWIADELYDIIDEGLLIDLRTADTVICEFPNFQDSGARSMGWRSGDLQRLTFLTGVFAARFREWEYIAVEPYKWKGQLPKQLVERRIKKRLGKDVCRHLDITSHAWDAVGIGLWYRDGGRP